MYATLLQSAHDTVQSYGRAKAGARPGGVGLRKKTKDLSASESVERGHGGCCGCVCYSATVIRLLGRLHSLGA